MGAGLFGGGEGGFQPENAAESKEKDGVSFRLLCDTAPRATINQGGLPSFSPSYASRSKMLILLFPSTWVG
jgi:hypothetical protein